MSTPVRLTLLGLALAVSACTHPAYMGPGPGPGPGYGPGWGMGPAMMGESGPYRGWGMGPGMGGDGPARLWGLERLDLSPEQRSKIAAIQDEAARRRWALMGEMHAQGGWGRGPMDDEGERRAYDAASALHKQMFELHLDARRRILEVLTPEQRTQLGRGRPAS